MVPTSHGVLLRCDVRGLHSPHGQDGQEAFARGGGPLMKSNRSFQPINGENPRRGVGSAPTLS